jgi:predicted small secreted protein
MKHAPIMLLAVLLSACSTVEGLRKDVSGGWNALTETVVRAVDPEKEAKKKLPLYDGTCPPVSVRPDLARMTDFYNPAKTDSASIASEASIREVKNICRTENGLLVMQIDLVFDARTGPKARVQPTDKPSFAYPYFIAVTDQTGTVLAKEVFAASIAFGADQEQAAQGETVFQTMPFPDSGRGQSYNVVVGFQLTPEQLAYNNRAQGL